MDAHAGRYTVTVANGQLHIEGNAGADLSLYGETDQGEAHQGVSQQVWEDPLGGRLLYHHRNRRRLLRHSTHFFHLSQKFGNLRP